MAERIPPLDLGEPVAKVEQCGRWAYRAWISHGLLAYGPYRGYGWVRWGRARAVRKAQRELARYQVREAWHASTATIQNRNTETL